MRIVQSILSALLLSTAAACGASEPLPNATATPVPPPVVKSSAETDLQAVCVSAFERQRSCSDTFIPTLVDARVRADVPAGIAEADRTRGRQALVAEANAEWQEDSTDQAIAATCRNLAAQPPAGAREAMERCLAESECQAFSTCAVDLAASHWR